MTDKHDKHDKLVEMALDAGFHAGKTISGQRYAYDGAGIDVTKELAAFADAHVASLCADVKPWVWLVTGSRVFDDQVEFTQSKAEARIAERKDGSECVPLVSASTVAAITAQRDAALARVAELEKDAARYRWLRDGELTADYPYPVMRMGGSRVDDQTIWNDELDAAIDAAMAKD